MSTNECFRTICVWLPNEQNLCCALLMSFCSCSMQGPFTCTRLLGCERLGFFLLHWEWPDQWKQLVEKLLLKTCLVRPESATNLFGERTQTFGTRSLYVLKFKRIKRIPSRQISSSSLKPNMMKFEKNGFIWIFVYNLVSLKISWSWE